MSVFAFLAGWCAGYFLAWYRSPAKAGTLPAIGAAIIPVMLFVLGAWGFTTVTHGHDRIERMRRAARDANTAPEVLERLALSTNEYVLGDAAANPKLSEASLRKLANHGGYLIEWGLARNRSTPREILVRLAGSSDEYTRGAVAGNVNAPGEVLAGLSRDVVVVVRMRVAQNPSTPRGTIEGLVGDADETVRRLADAALGSR